VLVFSAYVTPTQDTALIVAVSYVVLSILLSGLMVRLGALLNFMRWLSYLTPARYAFGTLVRQQFLNTSREPMLSGYDLETPDGANFGGMIAIYLILLGITLLALHRLSSKSRR
jgi:ABC-2 type transporter